MTHRPMGLVVMLALFLGGCGASRPSPELMSARAALVRAQSGPAREANPAGLYEARQALEAAERRQSDDPGSDEARSLAYIAERRSALAEVNARAAVANAARADAEKAIGQAREQSVAHALPRATAVATLDGGSSVRPPHVLGASRKNGAGGRKEPGRETTERRLPR